MSNQTTASQRLGIPITGEPSQAQILSFDGDTESMVWIDNNNGGNEGSSNNNCTKMATVSVVHGFTTGHIKLPFNLRTDTVGNLHEITLNSGETTTLSYKDQSDGIKVPDGKVIILRLELHVAMAGKCKFNIRASDTLDTADGDIVYSRDSERTLSIGTGLILSPIVIDTGKYLTVELIEGAVSVQDRSLVVTNDI